MTYTKAEDPRVEFEVTQGSWRITATYAKQDNVVIYRDGSHYRTVTFPAYKIWNIPAHLDEVVTSLEAERHDFLPVDGHPDDDECTYRVDGTDATYCGLPSAAHNTADGDER